MISSRLRSAASSEPNVSIIIPAKNEAVPLAELLPRIKSVVPHAEVLVVDDASSDSTAEVAARFGAVVVRHPYGMGNGAAIKTGARAATGDVFVFMDADGQHDPVDIPRLLSELSKGFDMVVGSRTDASQANRARALANRFYNCLASYMTGQQVKDLTSGFRAARASKFREFLYLLPNGFSYPTTSTMSFFRAGYPVGYLPVEIKKRIGASHIRPLQDGLRFLLIIFKVGTLYSPLKLFFPVSVTFFLTGLCYYLYTFVTSSRFTNMSALMLTTAVLVFLIGLVSEQITQLIYRPVQATLRIGQPGVESGVPNGDTVDQRVRRVVVGERAS
ncbi:MAG TPA: glycosyltransferase family 2 protein [Gammaproteobacteria bacterium]